MEEVDIKFICFNKRCVSNREQVFSYNERRSHTGHWEDVRLFNSKEMNELIQARGRYVRDACDWAKQHLFRAVNSKMNRLNLPAEDMYWNVTKNIITSRFSSLLGQNKNIVEHFQQGQEQDNKLWLLNNIYQGNEAIIREGIQIETLLLTKEITTQLEKQWDVLTEGLVSHNINILSSFIDNSKANVKEKERQSIAELVDVHQQLSNNLEKTKPIKKRGRKPRKRQVQENNNDDQVMKLEFGPVRLRLFEINQNEDIAKAVSCDRLVINLEIPQQKVLELISKLRPFQIVNNAYISFSSSFLDKIPIQIKSNLILLLEYWDFKDYYERITHYLFFYSQKKKLKKYKKLHMTSQNWKDLPNLKNIWIGSTQDLVQVKKASLKYDRISSLTIMPCSCCKKKPIQADDILKELNPIINLNTLVLSKININKETTKNIINFIRNNAYLTCVALNYSGTIGNGLIDVISKHKLTKLFICNQEQPQEDLDFRPVFSMVSLQYLTLKRAILTVEALKKISNLKNLIHLDIYDCYPVHSSILEDLHPNTHSSLVQLNLGYCQLEDLNVASLRKFKALKNLNLNGSFFNCQKVFEELITNPITSVTKLSIFSYNDEPLRLRLCRDKFTMNNQNFAIIAKAFPNLVYLAIGYDCMLTEINLNRFKKLKIFLANEKCDNLIISKDKSLNYIGIQEKCLN